MKVRLLALLLFLPLPLHADDAFRQDMLKWINAFRGAEGRTPVRLDDALNGVAQEWAARLAGLGRLQHRSLSNMKEIQGTNGYGMFNENLFLASGSPGASDVVGAWRNSSGHRRNLLEQKIDRIGIGAAEAAGVRYVVFNGAGGAPTPVIVPGSGAPQAGVPFGAPEGKSPALHSR